MTSRQEETSIHTTFNYACPNMGLSSTTILLGPLSLSFSSQWRMLCSCRHRGDLSDSFWVVLRQRGGHTFSVCFGSTAYHGRHDRSVTGLPTQLLSFLIFQCGLDISVSSPTFLSQSLFLDRHPLASWLSTQSSEWLLGLQLLKISISLLTEVLSYCSNVLKIFTSDRIGNRAKIFLRFFLTRRIKENFLDLSWGWGNLSVTQACIQCKSLKLVWLIKTQGMRIPL